MIFLWVVSKQLVCTNYQLAKKSELRVAKSRGIAGLLVTYPISPFQLDPPSEAPFPILVTTIRCFTT